MKITKEEIAEYRELSELVHKSLLRMKEIDSKIPKFTSGGGNYKTEIHRIGSVSIYPKLPLSKVINETRQVGICPKCNSSMIRKYWLYLWGKKTCINKDCIK